MRGRRVLLWWYALVCILFDLAISYCKHRTHINLYLLANPFFLCEFLLVTWAYWQQLGRKQLFPLLATALSAVFIWRTKGLSQMDFMGVGAFYFAYIVYSLLGFYSIISHFSEEAIGKSFFFWMNVAFLIYGSGAFLMFLFREFLTGQNAALYNQLWKYGFVSLNIIKNICTGIAIIQLTPARDT